MTNKIFNRKYFKAIEKIEENIEFYKGREQHYREELHAGGERYDMKAAVYGIEYCESHINALETILREIKYDL